MTRAGMRSARVAAVTAVVAVVLGGCSSAGSGSAGSGSAGSGSAGSGTPAGSASPPAASPSAAAPVLDQDFPDPDILEVDGTYYAYATQRPGPNQNIQLATSTDLKTWQTADKDPLPELPAWATTGRTWAPDVAKVGDTYLMYFTAHSVNPDLQCIGVARATKPTGPFVNTSEKPLICPAGEGGAIDAASFVDADGTRYLVWKNDGNCCGKDTWLQLQKTTPDGLRLAGPPVKLVKQDQPWEGNLVEAPTLVRRGSQYTLLYSANSYAGEEYATGYATADKITGPYRKAPQPLLSSSGTGLIGPGGQDVVEGPDGKSYLAVHGWDPAITHRDMYLLPITWQGAEPVVTR